MMSDRANLPLYVGEHGGASKLLHDGPETTEEIGAILEMKTPIGDNHYCFRLLYAAGNALIFQNEHHQYSHDEDEDDEPQHWIAHELGPSTPHLLPGSMNRTCKICSASPEEAIVEKPAIDLRRA